MIKNKIPKIFDVKSKTNNLYYFIDKLEWIKKRYTEIYDELFSRDCWKHREPE